jgi:predicted glycoside hydrolase/deacetylase ChbG (UPF0249 family)
MAQSADAAKILPGLRRLIIRGDDAGASPTANRAILQACRAGTLRNVSVMACGPAFDEFAVHVLQLPAVCIGLHVVLNSEWTQPCWGPVSGADRCPSLLREGGWFRHTPLDHHQNGFILSEAMIEVQAQLDRMRAAGLPPVYLDEHMGVGWLPGLRDALAELAAREGLLDLTAASLSKVQTPTGSVFDTAGSFKAAVDAMQSGTCMYVTHPDYPFEHSDWPGGPGCARGREADRRLLLDPELLVTLAESGVELVTVQG